MEKEREAPRGILPPLGASYGHFPETSSHGNLQKVRGFVVGFTGLLGGTTVKKILLPSKAVKGKIAAGESPGFQEPIEDFELKWCISGDDLKNKG